MENKNVIDLALLFASYWRCKQCGHDTGLFGVGRWSMAIPFGRKKDSFGRMEGNVLFDDALNTIYLLLYGVGHMVNDHSDS